MVEFAVFGARRQRVVELGRFLRVGRSERAHLAHDTSLDRVLLRGEVVRAADHCVREGLLYVACVGEVDDLDAELAQKELVDRFELLAGVGQG